MKVNNILYGVVVEYGTGGHTLDTYLNEDSAANRSKEIIDHIKTIGKESVKVYLSELEYDKHNNRILSDSLINSESELLFSN